MDTATPKHHSNTTVIELELDNFICKCISDKIQDMEHFIWSEWVVYIPKVLLNMISDTLHSLSSNNSASNC